MTNSYKDISLDWSSEVLARVGYGIQTRRILKPLIEGGATVKLLPNEDYIPEQQRIKDPFWINAIEKSKEVEETGLRVSFSLPTLYRKHSEGVNVGYTMWETTRYPREWLPIINQNNRFWVGSESLVDSAVNGGVEVPVDPVVPPLDVSSWTPDGPRLELSGVDKDTIVFLFVGCWLPRKNIVDLLTAFCCEFNGHTDVCLVIKTWGGDNSANFRGHVAGTIKGHIDALRGITRPKINLLTDLIDEGQIIKLLRRADVYTTASHGEGFDLPLVQSMACGCLPVVNTFLSHGDYVHPDNALVYNHFRKPCYGAGVPLYDAYQLWSVPDVKDHMSKLREAYNIIRDDKEKLAKITNSARETIKEKFDVKKTTDNLASLIRKIRDDNPSDKVSSPELVEASN